MRPITQIILHCSATPAGVHYTLHDIDHWHQQQGWNGCGYHYIILLDGTIHGHNEFTPKSCPCFDVQKEYPSTS